MLSLDLQSTENQAPGVDPVPFLRVQSITFAMPWAQYLRLACNTAFGFLRPVNHDYVYMTASSPWVTNLE